MLPEGVEEFAVRREVLADYFEPPIGRSTFYDLVNRGRIIPLKGLQGYYCLNESLVRMGMKPVRNPKKDAVTVEDLVRVALNMMEPDLFLLPGRFAQELPSISMSEGRHVLMLIERHRPELEALEHDRLKVAYGDGLLKGTLSDCDDNMPR